MSTNYPLQGIPSPEILLSALDRLPEWTDRLAVQDLRVRLRRELDKDRRQVADVDLSWLGRADHDTD